MQVQPVSGGGHSANHRAEGVPLDLFQGFGVKDAFPAVIGVQDGGDLTKRVVRTRGGIAETVQRGLIMIDMVSGIADSFFMFYKFGRCQNIPASFSRKEATKTVTDENRVVQTTS